MKTLLSIFLFLILSSKSYSLELSVEGLTDALGDVTKELEKVVQDNSKSEETETELELETSTNDNNFDNYPVEIDLKSKDYFNGCGHASAQYKFYEGNEFQLIYFCSEDSNETKYMGNFKNISDDLSQFSKVSTTMDIEGTQYKDIISLNKDNAKISWNGGDPIVYEYFSNEANVVVQKNNETTNNDTSSLISDSEISDSDENSKICKRALSKYDYLSGFDKNVTGNFLGGQEYLEVKNKIISEKKTFICPECKSRNVNLLEVNDIYRTQNGEGRGEFEWIFAEGNLNGYVKGWTLMDNNLLVQVAEVQGGSLSDGVYVNHLIVKKFSDNSDQGTMLFCLDEEESDRGYWTVDSQGNETRHQYYQSNYQKFDLQFDKKTMEQETKKTVDESKGGYKDFYFDMNISQIKNVVNQVCPQAEFSDQTSWGESLGYWDAPSCIDFRGKKTSLNFYTSKEDTIDKIILKNVDLSLDSMDFATYYSEDESGFVIYDEIVGKFLNSAKYELVRFPTKEEIDLFNSFDDIKILTGDASVNTVFKNLETGNLVYHTMKRNKYNNYGYEYDLIYLSPNASKSILKEEDSKTVSDDDI